MISFEGLKEAITFSDVDLQSIAPFDLGRAATGAPRLLFRPPAERAHYYAGRVDRPDECDARAARRPRHDVQVVLAPRYEHQIAYVERLDWVQPPIVLRDPAPFVPLLLAVDAVMSSGGTMLREAAYLGIPAYSIFRSEIGAVDRSLGAAGRLRIVERAGDLEQIVFVPAGPVTPAFPPGRELVDGLVAEMIARS